VTLFIPIVCLNLLVCLGLWMPISCGEAAGFQVTLLLALILYLDLISRTVPVFDTLGQSPRLLILFLITIIASVFAHIIISKLISRIGSNWSQDNCVNVQLRKKTITQQDSHATRQLLFVANAIFTRLFFFAQITPQSSCNTSKRIKLLQCGNNRATTTLSEI
jgi:hypothetical protein